MDENSKFHHKLMFQHEGLPPLDQPWPNQKLEALRKEIVPTGRYAGLREQQLSAVWDMSVAGIATSMVLQDS